MTTEIKLIYSTIAHIPVYGFNLKTKYGAAFALGMGRAELEGAGLDISESDIEKAERIIKECLVLKE